MKVRDGRVACIREYWKVKRGDSFRDESKFDGVPEGVGDKEHERID